jgi:aldehyde dehydrogenase (NAD+)
MDCTDLLARLGVSLPEGGDLIVRSPIDGRQLACVSASGDVHETVRAAAASFQSWRHVPPPRRGEAVRAFSQDLRRHKADLGHLITLETGKTLQEGLGEVQEMIDICDFAVGLSRQLHGLTIASERPEHRLMETWHPLGVVGIVSAFNFPAAVWAWNAALALVCGNTLVWKPSERTPLTALACNDVLLRHLKEMDGDINHISQVVIGGADKAVDLARSPDVSLLSATGSVVMGKALAPLVAARLGRSLLELGGNNAAIVCPSADLELTIRAVLFAAVGTAGQRCTTLRRLFVQRSVYPSVVDRLKAAYARITIGDPRDPSVLLGPLVDRRSRNVFQEALARAEAEGGMITGGKDVVVPGCEGGCYVSPALVEMTTQTPMMSEEVFAPLLYVVPFDDLDQAVAMNNAVPQGLSSSIFTNDIRESERFLARSDCGIANVNIGPSGAEIGGAFGGEKETGGGRESGSDCWKAYMRRATNTINYGRNLPLAQGIRFELEK